MYMYLLCICLTQEGSFSRNWEHDFFSQRYTSSQVHEGLYGIYIVLAKTIVYLKKVLKFAPTLHRNCL